MSIDILFLLSHNYFMNENSSSLKTENITNNQNQEIISPPTRSPKINKFKIVNLLYLIPVLIVLVCFFLLFKNKKQNEPVVQEKVVEETAPALFLAIDNPKSTTTSVNGEILVNGRTLSKSTVLIYSDIDENIVESDTDGKFESTVVVGDNGGLIKITAIADSGEEKSETVIIQENNQVSLNNQTNVLGKSDAPGQVKKEENSSGTKQNSNTEKTITTSTAKENKQGASEITPKLKSIKEVLKTETKETEIKKIGTEKIKEILSPENAGSISATLTKEMKKMVVSEASSAATLKRHGLSGVIIAINGNQLTLAHQIHREITYTVYYSAATLITSKDGEGTTLAVGMRIACVGEPVQEGILAKQIHIIPGKAVGIFSKQPVATEGGSIKLSPSPSASVSASPTPSVVTPPITTTIVPSPTNEVILSPTPGL